MKLRNLIVLSSAMFAVFISVANAGDGKTKLLEGLHSAEADMPTPKTVIQEVPAKSPNDFKWDFGSNSEVNGHSLAANKVIKTRKEKRRAKFFFAEEQEQSDPSGSASTNCSGWSVDATAGGSEDDSLEVDSGDGGFKEMYRKAITKNKAKKKKGKKKKTKHRKKKLGKSVAEPDEKKTKSKKSSHKKRHKKKKKIVDFRKSKAPKKLCKKKKSKKPHKKKKT